MYRFTLVSLILTIFMATASAWHLGNHLKPRAIINATCVTTKLYTVTQDQGDTSTFYGSVATSTSSLDCGGCSLTAMNANGNNPAYVTRYPTTVSMPVTTTTAYACLASPMSPRITQPPVSQDTPKGTTRESCRPAGPDFPPPFPPSFPDAPF